MLELAMILRRRRFARGALELNLPEVEIELGEQGQVTGAHLAVNDQSHQVIEEFMLAANEAVASYLTENHLFLRRVHPDPEPFKLDSSPSSPAAWGSRSTSRRADSSSSGSSARRPASPRNTPSTTACCAA